MEIDGVDAVVKEEAVAEGVKVAGVVEEIGVIGEEGEEELNLPGNQCPKKSPKSQVQESL